MKVHDERRDELMRQMFPLGTDENGISVYVEPSPDEQAELDDLPQRLRYRWEPRPEDGEENALVALSDVLGAAAGWAVRQHPYLRPPRLFEVLAVLEAGLKVRFNRLDGMADWAWYGHVLTLEDDLRELVWERCPEVMREWNTPRSNSSAPVVVSTRYGGPPPEDDIIDIDAWLRNVAQEAWKPASE